MTDSNELRKLWDGWQLPPELQRSRPRPVRFTGKGKATIIGAVVVLAVGIGGGSFAYRQAQEAGRRDRLLAAAGTTTEARITRVWQRSGKSRSCHAAYEFAAGRGEFTATAAVPCRAWGTLSVGDRVPVRYVPSDPRISRLEGVELAGKPPLWLAPLVLSACTIAALFIFRRLRRERHLLEEGDAAPGVVTKLGMRTDKGRKVYYEFATYSGTAVRGSYGPVQGKAVAPVGTPIVLLYDRDEPKRNTRYPSSLVALNY